MTVVVIVFQLLIVSLAGDTSVPRLQFPRDYGLLIIVLLFIA
jgi:hypothetical protein